ncbi:MAG: VIT domain-containing protein [Bacteroidota bacterium]
MKHSYHQILTSILLSFLVLPALQGQTFLKILNPNTLQDESSPGNIKEATISVKPSGVFSEIGLYLTFSPIAAEMDFNMPREVFFRFTLPKNSMINDSWLWVEDTIIKAEMRDRWSASFIYEDIVQRYKDPSILTKGYTFSGQAIYTLRVYPLLGDGERKVKISYLVPNTFTLNGQQVPLPLDLLEASFMPTRKVNLIIWPDEEWQNPFIIGRPEIIFEEKETPEGQTYLQTNISQYADKTLTLGFPSILQEGIFFKTHESNEDNYYQLVYLPNGDPSLQQPKKLTLIINLVNSPNNPSLYTYTDEEFLNEIKNFLLANLRDIDSINVVYPALVGSYPISAIPVFPSWVTASKENISQAIETVKENINVGTHAVGTLLDKGFELSQADPSATLFLITSSGGFSINPQGPISLVESLQEKYPIIPRVFISDLTQGRLSGYSVNGVRYGGDEYLNELLTQVSGGEFDMLLWRLNTLNEILNSTFQKIDGFFESFNIYPSPSTGFSYSRFNVNASPSLMTPSTAFLQIGKYEGELPLELSIAGEYQDRLYYRDYSLFPFSNSPLDSLTKSAWAGLQLGEWEQRNALNAIIQRIIELSKESRVLSEYTAFLALEPNDTTDACPPNECEDESVLPVSLSEQLEADLAISLAPNPFTDLISISGNVLSGKPLPTLKVIDMLGREVKVLPVELSGDKWEANWDGRDPSGNLLSAGIYLLRIEVEGQVITKRLVKQ